MITPAYSPTATERVLPRMALDFTTASLDSRVTVTRALNTATRTNSLGRVEIVNANLPRFDYDPVSLSCKGLLIEEARSNLYTYSEQFDHPNWTKTSSTISANATTSPDGTVNADKIIASVSASTAHTVAQTITLALNTTYTVSVFAKKAELDFLALNIYSGTTSYWTWYNLATGVIGTATGNQTRSITDFGNGWYRCTLTVTTAASGSPNIAIFAAQVNGALAFVGDGTSGIFLYGAQAEAGAFATSYIPTTTTSVTRNADDVSMTGTNFSDWYNASEGTFSGTAQIAQLTGTFPIWFSANDGTLDNFLSCYAFNPSSPNMVCISQVGAVQQYLGVPGPVTVNTKTNVSFAYKSSSLASAMNATGLQSAVSGTIPTVDRLTLGSSTSNFFLNGHLQKINYWPQRLTNNEVQAFSKVG